VGRHKGHKALQAVKDDMRNRWRILVRHPDFQADLRELLKPGLDGRREKELLTKWRLPDSFVHLKHLPNSAATLTAWERFFDQHADKFTSLPEYLTATGKRHRSDKLDFQLAIYDLYDRGERAETIAKTLKRPLATVKSAIAAAKKLLHVDGRPRRARKINFEKSKFEQWRDRHILECSICRSEKQLAPWRCKTALRELKLGTKATSELSDDWRYENMGLPWHGLGKDPDEYGIAAVAGDDNPASDELTQDTLDQGVCVPVIDAIVGDDDPTDAKLTQDVDTTPSRPVPVPTNHRKLIKRSR
jgi:aryl carrier-like protein